MERIAAGEAPGTLLEGLYLELPFPPPALGAPGLTHLGDGRALVRAAREFSNCLAGYVAEALRGERQYYVWREEGEADVVLSISNEGPFGWYLSECRLAGNERVPIGRRKALHRLLEPLGVRTGGSVEKLMGPGGGVLRHQPRTAQRHPHPPQGACGAFRAGAEGVPRLGG